LSLLYLFIFTSLGISGARVVSSTQDSLVIYWQLPDVDTHRVFVNGVEYIKVRGPEHLKEPGLPDLPSYRLWFALPPGSSPLIYVERGREEILLVGVPVLPVPKYIEDGLTPLYIAKSSHGEDQINFKSALLQGPYVSYLRHQRVGSILINPFSYNPKTRELRTVKEARIVVKFKKVFNEPRYRGKDPFENLYRMRLLNYEMGKNWRVKGKSLSWSNPFSGSEIWLKIQLKESGLYELKGSDLESKGIPMGISTGSLRLFTYGPDTLPTPIDSATTSMKEVAIFVDDGGDGHFDSDDRILFYGLPMTVRKWSGSDFLYFSNPYSDTAAYWLGVFHEDEGVRMEVKDVSPPPGHSGPYLTEGIQFRRHELNLYNIGKKGIRWEGEVLVRDAGSFSKDTTFTFDLPRLSKSSGRMVVDLVGGSDSSRFVEITLNDSVIDTVLIIGLRNSLTYYYPSNLLQSGNKLKIKLIARNTVSKPDYLYLDYFEVLYSETLSYEGGEKIVYFDQSKGKQVLKIKGKTPQFFLDITEPYHPVKFEGLDVREGEFFLEDSILGGKQFFLTDKAKSPLKISLKTTFPARVPRPADMIVVTPREFIHAIDNWLLFKERNLYLWDDTAWVKKGGDVWMVPTEEIYDAFGFGRKDPVAIRNFLKFESDTYGTPPTYLLLLGDGHYDYKGYITNTGNLVPPYEPYEIFDVNAEMDGALDDFYADMDWSGSGIPTPDMYLGRIPVRTTSQAAIYFRKSMRYEKGEANGPWRNRVLFVADDEFAEDSAEAFHTNDANDLYVNHTPSTIEGDKVYLIEIMPVSERGRLGHDALIEAFNRGELIAIAFMHGNPITMTHEHIFQAPLDYPLINAGPRNSLWVIGSCKISAFDRLTPPAVIGEDWCLREGGAIGVISSTTLSYPPSNRVYSRNILDQLVDYSVVPQGVLCVNAKSANQDKYYILLGDPSVPIGYPRPSLSLAVEGEKANGEKVRDTLYLNYEAFYTGSGAISPRVFVRSFEPEKDTTYYGPSVTITYRWIPRCYFSGTAYRTEGDSIHGSFFVPFNLETTGAEALLRKAIPRRISKEEQEKVSLSGKLLMPSGLGASVIVYDPSGLSGYVGVAKPLGVKPSEYMPFDTTGPTVRIFWKDNEIEDSLFVSPEVTLKIEISDHHGINTTQNLPGGEKGIVYILDSGEPVFLGHDFNYYPGTDTIGACEVKLSLGSGRHEFRVKAYDNLGNYSDRKVTLITAGEAELKLWDVLAYPNPVRKKGPVWFTFRVNREADLQVKVFTVAGRLVWKSPIYKATPGFNRVFWNGLDLDSDEISNGLYLFKVAVKTSGGEEVSRVERLLIAR